MGDQAAHLDSPVGGRRRIHYAWIVAITSFVTLLGAAGLRSTPSVLIDPLRALAAWGAGALHDVTGGYRISFVIAGACCLVAAAGVMRIRFDPLAGAVPEPAPEPDAADPVQLAPM